MGHGGEPCTHLWAVSSLLAQAEAWIHQVLARAQTGGSSCRGVHGEVGKGRGCSCDGHSLVHPSCSPEPGRKA